MIHALFRAATRLSVGLILVALAGCSPSLFAQEGSPPAEEAAPPETAVAQAEPPVAEQAPPTPTTIPATPTITPTPGPMPIPTPSSPLYTFHELGNGETLTYIASIYGSTIEEIVAMNNLSGPDAIIQVGQLLRVPVDIETVSPSQMLLPDSEVVYGPAYTDFDIDAFLNEQEGYVKHYSEYVDGNEMTGPEIIERVSEQFSVGPRVLIALLEYYGGWVTNPNPTEAERNRMLGQFNPRGKSLYMASAFAANRINAGYYAYKRDGFWIFELPDGSSAVTPQGLNAGTVGMQNYLSLHADQETWQRDLSDEGFMATYRELFGDPEQYALADPLVPDNLTQPPLSLPWQEGKGFYLTAGPHAGFVDGSAWAAVDFGPPDVLGNCFYSAEPNTAVADGLIVEVYNGEVYLDLDGDGNMQTGWVIFYMHMALDDETPVQPGQRVSEGDTIGYASCEGGLSSASHLHLARRYNGEWIPAGGAVPMTLDGWVVQDTTVPYDGDIKRGEEVREPCECWDPDLNLILNEPTQ